MNLSIGFRHAPAHGSAVALVSEPGAGTLVTVELPRR